MLGRKDFSPFSLFHGILCLCVCVGGGGVISVGYVSFKFLTLLLSELVFYSDSSIQFSRLKLSLKIQDAHLTVHHP